jgi:hypothetical protein
MQKADKQIWGVILFFTLIRLIVAPMFGLGVDEAHYALYGKYLDLSYVDHPPLVGWIHAAVIHLWGTNEFLVRLPAILFFAAVSYGVYLFTLRIFQSSRLALISVFALNCSFMLNALALMLLPDSILLLLVFPLIFTAERIERRKRPFDFILLGVILGLMGLAKYTAILLVPPLMVFFLMRKRFDVIFSPYMFLAAAIALIMVSPVFYWNMQHDWVSFKYQGGHVFGTLATSVKSFFESLGAQFGAYSPFLFLVAVYGFFKGGRRQESYLRLAVLFGATLMIFFMLTSLYERTLPHWPSIFYALFIPVGTSFLLTSQKKWQRNYLYISIGVSLVGLLLAYGELGGKFLRLPDYKSPFRDIYAYPEMTARADVIIKQNTSLRPKALAVSNWTEGSRVMYYNLPFGHEVFVIDDRKDQFDVWQKKSPEGYDLLFLNTEFHHINVAKDLRCDSVTIAEKKDYLLNGGKVNTVEFVWCNNYAGAKK